ncbi:MAG: hypothetical protein EP343_00315 [Deltaproteobacteria bacterium]|nr:MAG: hypothetical protein EP343_00315 [Deltaproteobacteria bacterium]
MQTTSRRSYPRVPVWLWGVVFLMSGSLSFCSSDSTGVKWITPPPEQAALNADIPLKWEVTGSASVTFNHTNVHACLADSNEGCTCVPTTVKASDCFNCCDGNDRSQCNRTVCPRIDSDEQNGAPGTFSGSIKLGQAGTWNVFVHTRINDVDYESDLVKVTVQ